MSGEAGLINSKPCPENPKLRIPAAIEKKILYVRREFGLGQLCIKRYLERYYGIRVSSNGVCQVLKHHGVNRLPPGAPKRSPSTLKRYQKAVPGHHVQIDVKFLIFRDKRGRRVKRYWYTAIDNAMRIRAIRGYHRHTQSNAIRFLNYVVKKFPFRVKWIRANNGHEFQSKLISRPSVARGLYSPVGRQRGCSPPNDVELSSLVQADTGVPPEFRIV